MNKLDLPLIIEPAMLEPLLEESHLLVVDMTKPSTYAQIHIPGAVYLDYGQIIGMRKPAMGLLPQPALLEKCFSDIGIDDTIHVVAYDDEGGGKAGRLLWTLEAMGHTGFSLLNGGLHAWANEGHPVEQAVTPPVPKVFHAKPTETPVATAEYIMEHLQDGTLGLLDARTPDEYNGNKRFAERGGHIPGAVNMDWMLALDQQRNLRLKSQSELEGLLSKLGLTKDQQLITYCHTHHRSSLTYIMLKSLGFPRVKGYPGSWSDWGNRQDTPVD
ncbi:MAG: sulfurtransferase [Sedimenticola sp.]|nr:sulfurtransferase [Sedimenticola sp.]MCW8949900.1 sulfurtransferase [Sedimenticola sp.]